MVTTKDKPMPEYAIWFCRWCGRCTACRKEAFGYMCRDCKDKADKKEPGAGSVLDQLFGGKMPW